MQFRLCLFLCPLAVCMRWVLVWEKPPHFTSESQFIQIALNRRFPVEPIFGPGGRRFKSSLPDHCFQSLMEFRFDRLVSPQVI